MSTVIETVWVLCSTFAYAEVYKEEAVGLAELKRLSGIHGRSIGNLTNGYTLNATDTTTYTLQEQEVRV